MPITLKQAKTVSGCFDVLLQFYFRVCDGLYRTSCSTGCTVAVVELVGMSPASVAVGLSLSALE